MAEIVHLRTSYRYASSRARDEAIGAALGMVPETSLRYAITLGSVVTVDVAIELFADHDYTLLALLDRNSVERSVTIFS